MNSGCGERQQEDVAVAGVPLVREELRTERRAEQRRADRARDAQADDDHHQTLHAEAEVVVLAFAREAGQLRQQRGLHGLEQQQAGSAATNRPVMNFATCVFCDGDARICTPSTLAYESSCASTEPISSHTSAPDSSE